MLDRPARAVNNLSVVRKTISRQAAIVSFRSLFNESDKGCTIIIASILEETLRQVHEAHVAAMTYPTKQIFNDISRPHAPLSTFAGVIQIAYGYGLISGEDYEDLQLVRKLRNEAAHSIHDFDLQDSGVQAVVMRLAADARYKQTTSELDKYPPKTKLKVETPEMTEAKRHLVLNGLALHRMIEAKLADAIERLLTKRKKSSARTKHH